MDLKKVNREYVVLMRKKTMKEYILKNNERIVISINSMNQETQSGIVFSTWQSEVSKGFGLAQSELVNQQPENEDVGTTI